MLFSESVKKEENNTLTAIHFPLCKLFKVKDVIENHTLKVRHAKYSISPNVSSVQLFRIPPPNNLSVCKGAILVCSKETLRLSFFLKMEKWNSWRSPWIEINEKNCIFSSLCRTNPFISLCPWLEFSVVGKSQWGWWGIVQQWAFLMLPSASFSSFSSVLAFIFFFKCQIPAFTAYGSPVKVQ